MGAPRLWTRAPVGYPLPKYPPSRGRYLECTRPSTTLPGYPPAESEIAAAMCVSPPSVNQMVKMLEKKGLLLRRPGQPRSLQILVPEDQIPAWNKRTSARRPAPAEPGMRKAAAPAETAPPANP